MAKHTAAGRIQKAKAATGGKSVGLRAEHVDKKNRVQVKVSGGEHAGERFKVLATPPSSTYFQDRATKAKKVKA